MELKKVSEFVWEIPKQGKMLVPAIVFASDSLMEKIKQDNTLQQAANVACLPGIIKAAYTMPDAHQGYGFPIGGVAAMDLDKGVISPGGVGFDINCGIRILATNLNIKEMKEKKKEVLHQIARDVPKGVGKGSVVKLDKTEIKEILETGARWAVKKGYGTKDDLDRTEDYGCIEGAKFEDVSERAI